MLLAEKYSDNESTLSALEQSILKLERKLNGESAEKVEKQKEEKLEQNTNIKEDREEKILEN